MANKNPFVNQTAYTAANNKRRHNSSNPKQDAVKIQQLQQATQILKQAKLNYRKGMAIDSVKVISKKFKLGGIKATAQFMDKMSKLPKPDIQIIKQIVARPKTSASLLKSKSTASKKAVNKPKKNATSVTKKQSNSTKPPKAPKSSKSKENNSDSDAQGFWPTH